MGGLANAAGSTFSLVGATGAIGASVAIFTGDLPFFTAKAGSEFNATWPSVATGAAVDGFSVETREFAALGRRAAPTPPKIEPMMPPIFAAAFAPSSMARVGS